MGVLKTFLDHSRLGEAAMEWQNVIEDRFEGRGFQTDWIWMNRHALFLLAWKNREILIHYVEWEGHSHPVSTADEVKDLYVELLGYLRRLDRWGNYFKGRKILFKWLAFKAIPEAQRKILEEAGVEPSFFLFDGGEMTR